MYNSTPCTANGKIIMNYITVINIVKDIKQDIIKMLQLLLARLHTVTCYTYYYYHCIAYYKTDKIGFSIIILLKFKSNFKFLIIFEKKQYDLLEQEELQQVFEIYLEKTNTYFFRLVEILHFSFHNMCKKNLNTLILHKLTIFIPSI